MFSEIPRKYEILVNFLIGLFIFSCAGNSGNSYISEKKGFCYQSTRLENYGPVRFRSDSKVKILCLGEGKSRCDLNKNEVVSVSDLGECCATCYIDSSGDGDVDLKIKDGVCVTDSNSLDKASEEYRKILEKIR
jgi:hypothetical protein